MTPLQSAVRRFGSGRLSCDLGGSGGGRSGDGGRVLLVIAHRIDTIIDMDRVLVLGGGRLLEDGEPALLARTPGGTFAKMVAASRVALPAARAPSGADVRAREQA
eukprot:360921-Chlamydomonas_euryale.AAC.7